MDVHGLVTLLSSFSLVRPQFVQVMIYLWTAALAVTAAAQYFPPIPDGLKVVESQHQKGVKIAYKQVRFSPKSLFIDNLVNYITNSDTDKLYSLGSVKQLQG